MPRTSSSSIAKFSRPRLFNVVQRERLFLRLDTLRQHPLVWVSGPPGAGKTTLIASYLQARHLRHLWYEMDPSDGDIATFFFYVGEAAQKISPRRKRLPLFGAEYVYGVEAFTRNFFDQLFARLPATTPLVFDNYQEVSADSSLHDVLGTSVDCIRDGRNIVVISRQSPPPPFARRRANGRAGTPGLE